MEAGDVASTNSSNVIAARTSRLDSRGGLKGMCNHAHRQLTIALLVASVACGDSGCAGDGGVVDDSIWPPNATKIAASSGGGGQPPPAPAGSECSGHHEEQYTLVVATRSFSFDVCAGDYAPSEPLKLIKGERTLTQGEFNNIDLAMQELELPEGRSCFDDHPFSRISVTTPAGEKSYLDSSACGDPSVEVFIDNIDAVFKVFYGLATLR